MLTTIPDLPDGRGVSRGSRSGAVPSRQRLRRAGVAAAVATGVLLVVAGCGGQTPAAGNGGAATSPTPAAASGTPAATPPPAGSAPNPNAAEVIAAGDIPDNQEFVPFSPPGGAFSVSVPQGWVQSAVGAGTLFTDKFNSVRIDTAARASAPDVASARALEVPQLQSSAAAFVLQDVQLVQRSAGPAELITYVATSAPNAVTGKSVTEAVERYAFWTGGREVVLTLSGAQGSDNVDPWKKITDSFRWQR